MVEKEKEKFATVKACLDAGHTWEDCMGLTMQEGKLKGIIKKSCPEVMKMEIKNKVFSGEAISFVDESMSPENLITKEMAEEVLKKYAEYEKIPNKRCKTGDCGGK